MGGEDGGEDGDAEHAVELAHGGGGAGCLALFGRARGRQQRGLDRGEQGRCAHADEGQPPARAAGRGRRGWPPRARPPRATAHRSSAAARRSGRTTRRRRARRAPSRRSSAAGPGRREAPSRRARPATADRPGTAPRTARSRHQRRGAGGRECTRAEEARARRSQATKAASPTEPALSASRMRGLPQPAVAGAGCWSAVSAPVLALGAEGADGVAPALLDGSGTALVGSWPRPRVPARERSGVARDGETPLPGGRLGALPAASRRPRCSRSRSRRSRRQPERRSGSAVAEPAAASTVASSRAAASTSDLRIRPRGSGRDRTGLAAGRGVESSSSRGPGSTRIGATRPS